MTAETLRLRSGIRDIERGAALIREGRLVVFPTETVYGLGADATSDDACRRVFLAKDRPPENPLIVHYGQSDHLLQDVAASQSGGTVYRRATDLLEAFAPGPLTLVVPRLAALSRVVSAGLPTVAVRVPNHPLAREMIKLAGVPVAAPSANRSGRPSPTTGEAALLEMDGRVAAVIDGGACTVGLESTVIDISGERVVILRPGVITAQMITRSCGLNVVEHRDGDRDRRRSPGTRFRHYTPHVPVLLVDSHREDKTSPLFGRLPNNQMRVRALVYSQETEEGLRFELGDGVEIVRFVDTAAYGAALYREFFRAERDQIDALIAEKPDPRVCPALCDRLIRAASPPQRDGDRRNDFPDR